jgi:uncharacterized protein (TIGR02302 family)
LSDEDRPKNSNIPLPPGRLALAWLALFWERLWPALWPFLGVLALFATLALSDVLPELSFAAHAAILALFAAALAWSLWRAARSGSLPERVDARRRLERDNKLDHRPLAALEDRLAAGKADGFAEALWREHRRRLIESLKRLKVRLPSPGSARRDPMAVRALVILLLAVALGAGWYDALPRVKRALSPSAVTGAEAAAAAMEMWITPPDYTGLPPVFVRAGEKPAEAGRDAPAVLTAPAGSKLLAQVHGRVAAPRLRLGGENRDFAAVDETTYRIESVLTQGGELAIDAGRRQFGRWTLEVVPDKPPTVEFAQAPQRTQRSALRVEYTAADDYGIASVKAAIRLVGEDDSALAREEPIELELPLPGLRLKQAKAASFHDLTAHIWAGLKVEMKLVAQDEIGQTGTSEPIVIVLPERVFNHPVARAIVEQRKQLSLAPDKRRDVSAALHGILQRPALFFDDTVVYLALKSAQARLLRDGSKESIRAVQQLMWDTALRIEDGKLSLAERDLRDAERRLMDALNKNATDPEIERLINELQQALDNYLQALAEQLRQQLQQGMQPQPMDPNAQVIDSRDLQRMIEQARELARQGNRDAAKQLLSQLREMLENMRQGMMAQMSPQARQAQQMMNNLQDLIKRQRDLLDQTFRDAQQQGKLPPDLQQRGMQQRPGQRPGQQQGQQQGQQGQQGQQQGRDGAQRQGQLRGDLGDFLRRLDEMMGNIPRPFGRADRAMRDAQGSLEQGEPGDAVGHQNQALDQLQEAARGMMEQMMQQMGMRGGPGPFDGEMPPQSMGPMPPRPNQGRDPFGRPQNNFGGVDTGDVMIPEQSDMQRARDVLDELRKRRGEPERPPLERDYIDRLLKRF